MSLFVKFLRKFFKFSTIGPALDRYYLLPRIKLHRIYKSDEEFHTHPWNGCSFIFGKYKEIRGDGSREVKTKWFFNRVRAFVPHKVIVDKPVWTLFIHGPRINENWHYGYGVKPWEGSDQERENEATRTRVDNSRTNKTSN